MSSGQHRVSRGRKRTSRSGNGTIHELNITPLLDLVMVLLIIFMITTPQLSNDLDLSLPSGRPPAKKPNEKPKIHYVDVAANGALLLNRQPATLAQLPPLLKAIKSVEPDPSFVVRGADEVNYEHIVGVIDLLQQADITKVGMATAVAPGGAR
jgi:biopolymer transport protein ExbD